MSAVFILVLKRCIGRSPSLTKWCLPPPAGGWYCQGDANEVPTARCDAGWYCSGGAYAARPSPYDNSTGDYSVSECPIYALNNTGDICPPGMCM